MYCIIVFKLVCVFPTVLCKYCYECQGLGREFFKKVLTTTLSLSVVLYYSQTQRHSNCIVGLAATSDAVTCTHVTMLTTESSPLIYTEVHNLHRVRKKRPPLNMSK